MLSAWLTDGRQPSHLSLYKVGVGGDASSVISSSYEDTSPIMGALTS